LYLFAQELSFFFLPAFVHIKVVVCSIQQPPGIFLELLLLSSSYLQAFIVFSGSASHYGLLGQYCYFGISFGCP